MKISPPQFPRYSAGKVAGGDGIGVGGGEGEGDGAGDGASSGVGDGDGLGSGVGDGDGSGVGDGDGVGVGDGDGSGAGDGLGDVGGKGEGEGEGLALRSDATVMPVPMTAAKTSATAPARSGLCGARRACGAPSSDEASTPIPGDMT